MNNLNQTFMQKYNMKEISEKDGFIIDIVYATPKNFTNQVLYEYPICMLREGTANKLIKANEKLKELGYKIKIWDTYRPIEYQRKMFEIYPDENFVANPDKTECNHCKGCAVDVTLCTLDNKNVEMPTEFDHFGIESYRNYYSNLDEEKRKNVVLLENIMVECGFSPYEFEWWHFNDSEDYEVIRENYFKN